jgi:hypothetical protein
METFQKQCCFGNRGALNIKLLSLSFKGLMVPKAYSEPWALLRIRHLYSLYMTRSSHGSSTQDFSCDQLCVAEFLRNEAVSVCFSIFS